MTLAYNKIISKLQALDEYLRHLKQLQKVNKNSFLKDYHHYGLAEHYLHLSIEALLDTAKLLIAVYGFPRPEEQQEALDILYERKVINKALFQQLAGISGFRNILIHEYQKVDRLIVYTFLQNNIGQFVEFKKQVLRFLRKKTRKRLRLTDNFYIV